jgi:hypothetical protein
MRKIISCKVIRTIPLNNSSYGTSNTNRSDVKSHNINNATVIPNPNRHTWEMSINPQTQTSKKSVLYTKRLNISRIPIENGYSASIFNCYA